jgi:hypothetical protein
LQPFGIADIGLAPWHVLGVARVDQHCGETALLQNLEDWDPVNACTLHGDRRHAALLEPIGDPMQVTGEGTEAAHRLRITIRIDSRHVQSGPNVDRGRMGVYGRHRPYTS